MLNSPKVTRLIDYKPYPFVLENVRLDFELEDHSTIVRSTLKFHRNPKSAEKNAALKLNGEKLKLHSVKLDGRLLDINEYMVDAEFLSIEKIPNQFQLEIEVMIDPKNNLELMGLYQSRGNFCTQCEAHGFRKITYFPDRPDVMTQFTVSILADRKRFPYLLSNGNLIEEKIISEDEHYVVWQDPSLKPCYLFALVAGDFDVIEDEFITMSGRNVDLRLYLEKGQVDQGHFAMESIKNAMKWDEVAFGREYDLDIFMVVAVNDFNFGAMENKGLNIFNTKYILAKPKTASDSDYLGVEKVIGHEYFHNWSGDRVTCRDWFQITLKEGLTVFRDQEFTGDMNSRTVERIDAVNTIRNAQFLQDAGPMAHPIRPESYIEINNFYTVTVYNKGSEVIRMVHTLLGTELFRKGMDLYFSRFDGQAVTTEDFIACMAEVSGRDFTQFCRWYHQAGTPILNVSDAYDVKSKTYRLTVKQTCAPTADGSPKEPFHIPFSIGLLKENSEEILTKVLDVKKPEETFEFKNIDTKPIPSLLRNFSAPVKLEFNYSDENLAWLMQHDTDAFNRWNAAQTLSLRVLLTLVADLHNDSSTYLLSQSFSTILKTETDFSLAARMLTLPSENYVLQQLEVADVDAVHTARQYLRKSLAKTLEPLLKEKYAELNHQKKYVFNAKASGERSFKNLLLHYLLLLDTPELHTLAFDQFHSANNMTDQFAAMSALNDLNCMQRNAVLTEFLEHYENETLVMDKWLSLQAQSFLPNTLDQVKNLLKHSVYDAKNPNKIRALVGGFSSNLVRFHDKSGKGYAFLADQVLNVDHFNPMTAARLVEPFTRWKQFDSERQALIKKQLEYILRSDKAISKDLYEVVSKSLQAN